MLLNYKSYVTILYHGANVCPVSSIAVSFIKNFPFAHISSFKSTNKTHSHHSHLRPSKQMLIWTSQMFMKFSLQVGHSTKSMAHGFTRIFTRVVMGIVGIVMGALHTGEAILRVCEPEPGCEALFSSPERSPPKTKKRA